jgi:hypothetical protein
MAFQSAANSNRSQNKDMPKKQQNLTYRQSKNSSFKRKNHDYDSKGYSNEYKTSYDNIDDDRTGFNGENYNHNSTNEEVSYFCLLYVFPLSLHNLPYNFFKELNIDLLK